MILSHVRKKNNDDPVDTSYSFLEEIFECWSNKTEAEESSQSADVAREGLILKALLLVRGFLTQKIFRHTPTVTVKKVPRRSTILLGSLPRS